MNPNGYVKLHRKILESWQWSRSEWAHLWSTMMVLAEYEDQDDEGLKRGQFFSSVAELHRITKIPETNIRRFLQRCLDEKDLLWEKSPGGRRPAELVAEFSGGVFSRFTIVKFDLYNGVIGGVSGGVVSSSSYRKKKKRIVPVSDETTPKKTKEVPRDLETLRKLLEGIDRKKIAEQFPDVDVRAEWSKFQRDILEGTPKHPRPNPFDWKGSPRSWQAGFRNWCENARKWGGRETPVQDSSSNNPAYKPLKDYVITNGPEIYSKRKHVPTNE